MKQPTLALALALGLVSACSGEDMVEPADDPIEDPDDPMDPDDDPEDDPGVPLIGPCSVERAGGSEAIFHDADGLPLATVEFVDDVAEYDECARDTMITVADSEAGEGDGTIRNLFTVQGVQPEDHVLLDPLAETAPPMSSKLVTITSPLDDVTVGADEYLATAGDCEGGDQVLPDSEGGNMIIDQPAACMGDNPGDFNLVSIARDTGNDPVGFSIGTGDADDNPANIVTGPWIAHDGPTTVELVNLPEGVDGSFHTVRPLIDGVSFYLSFGGLDLETSSVDMDFWPVEVADDHRVGVSLSYADGYSASTVFFQAEAPAAIDLEETTLAPPSNAVLVNTDPTRPRYLWADGDDRAVSVRGQIEWTDAIGSGSWIIVAPGNPGELVAPVLPAEYDLVVPAEHATNEGAELFLLERGLSYSELLGYGLSTDPQSVAYPHEYNANPGDAPVRLSGFYP